MQLQVLQDLLDQKIDRIESMGGGCVGESVIVHTRKGELFFAKSYDPIHGNIVEKEAHGLKLLQNVSKTIRIPKVIAQNEDTLVLEYIKQGPKAPDFWHQLAKGMLEIHSHQSELFGLDTDNFLGRSPQHNRQSQTWGDFFVNERLKVQYDFLVRLDIVDDAFENDLKKIFKVSKEILEDKNITPCLVHGDMWSGNIMSDQDGRPVLFDPAVYFGHYETDLAMNMLFGGFPREYFDAYTSLKPFKAGFQKRLSLYNLYHALNHINLFGANYLPMARDFMGHVLS